MKRIIFIILIILAEIFIINLEAQDKETYYVFLPVGLGFGAISIENQKDLLQVLINYAKEKLNLEVKVEIKGDPDSYYYKESWNEIFKEFKAGKEAITFFPSPLAYIEAEELKIPLRPYLSIAVEGKNKISYCIYVNSECGLKSLKQLKGKSIFSFDNSSGAILILKNMLVEKGITESLLTFFSNQVPYQDNSSAIQALIKGKLDCYFSDVVSTKFAMKTVYDAESVVPLECSKPYTTTAFLGAEEKNPELTKKVIDIVNNISKNPELKKFESLLQGFGASFIKVSPKDYDDWRNLYKTAKKNGWLAEIDNWDKRHVEKVIQAEKEGRIKPKRQKQIKK